MKRKHFLSLLLVLTILVQTCAFASSAAVLDTQADYDGLILAAVNTDYKDLAETFSAYCPQDENDPAAAGERETHGRMAGDDALLDAVFDDVEVLSAAQAAVREREFGKNAENGVEAVEYRVGDRKTVRSSARDEYESRYVDVECVYTGTYCTVWNEIGGERTAESSVRLGEGLDEMIPQEWEIFGRKCIDTDCDGKIAIFVYRMDSGYGGYFSTSDLVDRHGRIGKVWTVQRHKNQCDCVHVYPFADVSMVAHEYQHYLHAGYDYVGKNNLTYLYNPKESYINEGFSCCAQVLFGGYDRAGGFADYAAQTDKYSLVNWSFDSGAYTLSYMFSQYLRTRYAQLIGDTQSEIPGVGLFKTILETRASKHVRNTLSIAADLLYPKDRYPQLKTSDSRCRQLLVDFWLAVFCLDESGEHGFNGEEWANVVRMQTQVGLPEQGSDYIRSGMCAYYQIRRGYTDKVSAATAHVTDAGKDMVFVGLDGVGRAVTYDWNNGRWRSESYLRLAQTEYVRDESVEICDGRILIGWSTDPRAETPMYTGGEQITLSAEHATVLYGVWKDAEPIGTGETKTLRRETKLFRFVPPQDGYYAVDTQSVAFDVFAPDGRSPDGLFVPQADDDLYVCALTAGVPYDIYAAAYSRYKNGSIRIDPVNEQYTLRCYCGVEGTQYLAAEYSGWNCYRIDEESMELSDYLFAQQSELAGWARTPDAETPEFGIGDSILLTADTSLYAVIRPMQTLYAETERTLTQAEYGERFFVLRPETDGTYTFSVQDSADEDIECRIGVYDADRTYLQTVEIPPEAPTASLRGGKSYILLFDPVSSVPLRVCIRKTADAASSTLTLYCGADNNPASFSMQGQFVYTIPRIIPASAEGADFLGWAEYSAAAEPDYKPGDTVEITADHTLYAVWKPRYNQTRVQKVIRFLWQTIRVFLQDLRYRKTVKMHF